MPKAHIKAKGCHFVDAAKNILELSMNNRPVAAFVFCTLASLSLVLSGISLAKDYACRVEVNLFYGMWGLVINDCFEQSTHNP